MPQQLLKSRRAWVVTVVAALAIPLFGRGGEGQFSPDSFEHRGVTHFYAVPTIFIRLLNSGLTPKDLPSVRYFFSAAATMPTDVARRWQEIFGSPIHEGYGLTETSSTVAVRTINRS